ncbi:diphthine synthase [Branchiostoma belcheri]|nr:diphthine synthase [Branchiostoma belcheri]
MLYLVGLGLGDAKDITVKGLEVVKRAKRVFLEAYTSILTCGKDALEEFYGREVILADRDMVEQESDAKEEDIAFLVVGDPFGATTHSDLVLRAIELDIPYKVIHNASIMNAVGCCGLQLYNFGETVSVVFWTDDWKPDSYYDKIAANREKGWHTLCLGRKIYEPPRYMMVKQAAQQFLEIVQKKREQGAEKLAIEEDTICVGLARVGTDTQQIAAGTLTQLAELDMGGPLHSLVIPGHMHPLEIDMLRHFAIDRENFERSVRVEE